MTQPILWAVHIRTPNHPNAQCIEDEGLDHDRLDARQDHAGNGSGDGVMVYRAYGWSRDGTRPWVCCGIRPGVSVAAVLSGSSSLRGHCSVSDVGLRIVEPHISPHMSCVVQIIRFFQESGPKHMTQLGHTN